MFKFANAALAFLAVAVLGGSAAAWEAPTHIAKQAPTRISCPAASYGAGTRYTCSYDMIVLSRGGSTARNADVANATLQFVIQPWEPSEIPAQIRGQAEGFDYNLEIEGLEVSYTDRGGVDHVLGDLLVPRPHSFHCRQGPRGFRARGTLRADAVTDALLHGAPIKLNVHSRLTRSAGARC